MTLTSSSPTSQTSRSCRSSPRRRRASSASACPDCTINELDISIADLTSGAASSQIISTMQQNPDTDYVMVSIGDMATGLPEALDSAGMQAGIVGWGHNPTQLQYLIDGTTLAFAPGGSPAGAWYAVDAMARLSLGMDALADEHDALPVELLTSALVADANETYPGPRWLRGRIPHAVGRPATVDHRLRRVTDRHDD